MSCSPLVVGQLFVESLCSIRVWRLRMTLDARMYDLPFLSNDRQVKVIF